MKANLLNNRINNTLLDSLVDFIPQFYISIESSYIKSKHLLEGIKLKTTSHFMNK